LDKERLVLLNAEIEFQTKEIEDIYSKLDERSKERTQLAIESLGYQLHNLYCAFEDLFKIISKFFENHIEDKSRYHSELLKKMAYSIEDVRPAFLSRQSMNLLDNLRAFRHFFRHAYSYTLDERKIWIVYEDAMKLREVYKLDYEAFFRALKKNHDGV